MKLPNWIRPRDASLDELQAQLEAARGAHSKAETAHLQVRERFDTDPSTEREFLAARDQLVLSEEHVARAERLLEAAKAKAAAERRAQLEARRAELQEQLAGGVLAARRRPGAEAEAAALLTAVDARMRRLALEQEIRRAEHELHAVRLELGEESRPPEGSVSPFVHDVRELVQDALRQAGGDPYRQRALMALGAYLDRLSNHH